MIERVRKLIKQRGITQKFLAESIGLSEQSLCDKLYNRTAFTAKDFVALADFFHVSVDYLMGRTGSDGDVA